MEDAHGRKAPALAIDDFSFSASAASGVARNLIWAPGSTTWNASAPSNMNWTVNGTSTSFAAGDAVTFTDAGTGTVNVDPVGVAPTSVVVNNSAGVYTFTGGAIGGSLLTKSNTGTLVLSSSNSFGGLAVLGGKVIASTEASLGAAGSSVTFDNGATLSLGSSFTTSRPFTVNSGGGTIDTGAFAVTNTAAFSVAGPLVKAGTGSYTIKGTMAANPAGTLAIAGGSVVFAGSGGTQAFVAPAAAGSFNGNLIIVTPTRMAIDGGLVNGSGDIEVQSNGAAIIGATPGGGAGPTITTIDVPIRLNTLGQSGPFVTTIGMSTAGNALMLTSNAIISGTAAVQFTNQQSGGGGAGAIVLGSINTYTGPTTINNGNTGFVQLGVNNALPTGTALSFGDGSNTSNIGALDLAGHDQTVGSLATSLPNLTGTPPQQADGITNSSSSLSTFSIGGTATTTFAAVIGTNLGGGTNTGGDNIALALAAAHTGKLTLQGLNTFTGATTINGGTLQIDSAVQTIGENTQSSLPNGNSIVNNASLIVNAPNTAPSTIDGSGVTTINGTSLSYIQTLIAPTLTVNTINQGSVVNNGAVTIATGGMISGSLSGSGVVTVGNGGAAALSVGGLVNVSGTVSVSDGSLSCTPPPTGTAVTHTINTLNLNSLGKLDVGNSSFYTTSSSNTIQQYLTAGYNGGLWNGSAAAAIVSTSANLSGKTRSLGFASDADVAANRVATNVVSISPGQTLVKYTTPGDANLSGTTDFTDFLALQAHYQQSNSDWSQGDFNYSGSVDFSDFLILQSNYQHNLNANGTANGAANGAAVAHTASLTASSSSSPSVTYILKKDDDGHGNFASGKFAVYAVDSSSDGNQGMAAFSVTLQGYSQISNTAGDFTLLHSASGAQSALTESVAGSQNTFADSGEVYGMGQAGSGPLLIATGSYTDPSALGFSANQTLDEASVFSDQNGNVIVGGVSLVTVPEPDDARIGGIGDGWRAHAAEATGMDPLAALRLSSSQAGPTLLNVAGF